jgi:hypothetical protein
VSVEVALSAPYPPALHAMRCGKCNHGWFVPVADAPVIVKRKPDRRAKAPEK